MDKETAVEIQKLKGDVETLKEANKAWNQLIRDAIVKTVSWLLVTGIIGILYGYHLSVDARKAFMEWVLK